MIRIENIIQDFQQYAQDEADCSPLHKAYILATKAQRRASFARMPYLQRALAVAHVLTELRLDIQSIVAGLLNGILIESSMKLEELTSLMGKETAGIIDGVTLFLKETRPAATNQLIAGNMRSLMFATQSDVRVLFVALAIRLVQMRNLGRWKPKKARFIARETLETYAPISERLGLGHIKIELEDLSFSYLHSKDFAAIKEFCDSHESFHKSTLEKLKSSVEKLLKEHKIEGKINTRIKHYYSIYNKALRANVSYEHVSDLLGLRVILNNKTDCFRVLGLVNSEYRPAIESFKDYISYPKPNGYQSLHTKVYDSEGIGFEVQIRTEEMDNIAGRGVAAHWAYKVERKESIQTVESVRWISDLTKSLSITSDSKESLEIFTRELYSDFVYVFTPKGKIITLPVGASVIDFAYAIHTELGNNCTGATINGRKCSIKTILNHGDKVEILSETTLQLKAEWLAYALTTKALSQIRYQLRKTERREAEGLGKELFNEQLIKLGKSNVDIVDKPEIQTFLKNNNYENLNEFFVQLGFGKANITTLRNYLVPLPVAITQEQPKSRFSASFGLGKKSEIKGVRIAGIENIMVRYANCCSPIKGDDIVGVVTRGKGVAIHLNECINIRSQRINPERIVEVEWVRSVSEKLPVRIHIEFDDQIKTNFKIMKALVGSKVILLENSLRLVNKKTYQDITVTVEDHDHVEKLLNKMNSIPSVEAHRRLEAEERMV